MSVTIYGQHDGDAIFEDDNGWARVPTRLIHVLYRDAIYRGVDEITWLDRPYLVGTIEQIRNDIDSKKLSPLDTCTADGCEDAAPFSLRDARPRCASHAKED